MKIVFEALGFVKEETFLSKAKKDEETKIIEECFQMINQFITKPDTVKNFNITASDVNMDKKNPQIVTPIIRMVIKEPNAGRPPYIPQSEINGGFSSVRIVLGETVVFGNIQKGKEVLNSTVKRFIFGVWEQMNRTTLKKDQNWEEIMKKT